MWRDEDGHVQFGVMRGEVMVGLLRGDARLHDDDGLRGHGVRLL